MLEHVQFYRLLGTKEKRKDLGTKKKPDNKSKTVQEEPGVKHRGEAAQ